METQLSSFLQVSGVSEEDNETIMKIRRAVSMSASLPAISEDGNPAQQAPGAPAIPPRSLRRNSNRNFAVVGASNLNHQEDPPSYWEDDNSIDGKYPEKLSRWTKEIINNKHVAKRGGWLRLCLIALVVLLCIVGLVVGLVVGLRKKDHKQSNSSSDNDGQTAGFPVGSYSINTFLSNVTTDCTSNPNTWLCYPFSTYAQSPNTSEATFDWIISVDSKNIKNYSISSTENYFSIMFANLTLTLKSANTLNEHYFLSTTVRKPTRPTTQIGNSNLAATCQFDSTFQAYLFTRMAKTYPESTTNSATESGAFTPWPYAVRIEQLATSGAGTPTCTDPNGNSLGNFAVSEPNRQCSCDYLNTGT